MITQERDYACIDELLEKVNKHNAEADRTSGIIVACGMAKYENDPCVVSVFERADKEMYKNKLAMKAARTD